MASLEGNMQAQPRVFAHDMIPLALGNINPDGGITMTSGGTGFGVRDYTPEAIKPLLHREAPGISQALLAEGLKFTPLALLSRPIAGTRNNTFICTLPGSVKAIRENIGSLKPLLPRIIELVTEKVVREK